MLFINKATTVPEEFTTIVNRHPDYDRLSESGEDRDKIKFILLNEQGCLCPFCERQLDISTATIEHFLPKSSFKRVQLDYYNLFACCHVCNNKKTDHLIPAYIFDERLNPLDANHLILKRHKDFQLFHYVNEGEADCFLRVKSLEKRPKDGNQDNANWILFLTTEVLELNDPVRLREPRGRAYSTILRLTDELYKVKDKKGLIAQYHKFRTPRIEPSPIIGLYYRKHESYLSMVLYLLAERLRKLGVDLENL